MTILDPQLVKDGRSWSGRIAREARALRAELAHGETTFGQDDARVLGALERVAEEAERLGRVLRDVR